MCVCVCVCVCVYFIVEICFYFYIFTKINCLWIRDVSNEIRRNITERKMTCTIVNMTGRLERGRGRGSLSLLHRRHRTFWGMSSSSRFMRRLHPWGGTLHSYSNRFIIGIMLSRNSELVPIHGIVPWRRKSTLSLGCLRGGRIGFNSLSFLSVF